MAEIKNNTEAAILEAAERLFLEKGFKGATTTLIAKEAGVTHAMLHYYFRTKEQVFINILDKNISTLLSRLKAQMDPEADFADIVKDVTAKHFDFVKEHSSLIMLMVETSAEHPEVCEKYVDSLKSIISSSVVSHTDRLEKAIAEGKMKPITIQDLLLDLLYINTAPFMFLPVMKNVLKMNQEELENFFEERKAESIRIIQSRIETK
ncbi:MAG: TetR/AcrR family transcriptional regulator [Candidatus Cryptobacteroides sp.]